MSENENNDEILIPKAIPENNEKTDNSKPDQESFSSKFKSKHIAHNTLFGDEKNHQRTALKPHFKPVSESYSIKYWFSEVNWSTNPFTLSILPSLLVGYNEQLDKIMNSIYSGHKLSMIVGPTGSGKTTMLKWLTANLKNGYESLYISKMPQKAENFVDIFNEKFKKSWILRWFNPHIKNLYQIPNFLNKKLGKKHLIVLCDEIHEADQEVLEWLRVLTDQVDNMSLIVSGLPVFEANLKENLETFRKRITTKVELLSLTKEETEELIKKRIESVGGNNSTPFTSASLSIIYERTGGFPREVLRMCDDMVNKAVNKRVYSITPDLAETSPDITAITTSSMHFIDSMTSLKKNIIELLAIKPRSPGEIANLIDLSKYKTRQHAVRSVNNILKRMMTEDFIERERTGRAFLYVLSPRIKTLVVKA